MTGVTSTEADGSYTNSDVIYITITFDRVVIVDTTGGTPYLELETGTTDRKAAYSNGSDTDTLTFEYTVHAGDTASDLDYTGRTALILNGGTIMDAAGTNAKLLLAPPGDSGSLGYNKALVIETKSQDSLMWIWLVSIFGGLGLLLVIGSIIIIKRRRSAKGKTKRKSSKGKVKRKSSKAKTA